MTNVAKYFYIQGIIMSAIALGFYIYGLDNLSIYRSPWKTFLKLIFSICTAWILGITIIGSLLALGQYSILHPNWFVLAVIYIFPYILFIGFQMNLYDLFREH